MRRFFKATTVAVALSFALVSSANAAILTETVDVTNGGTTLGWYVGGVVLDAFDVDVDFDLDNLGNGATQNFFGFFADFEGASPDEDQFSETGGPVNSAVLDLSFGSEDDWDETILVTGPGGVILNSTIDLDSGTANYMYNLTPFDLAFLGGSSGQFSINIGQAGLGGPKECFICLKDFDDDFYFRSATLTADVPEPATLLLLGFGLVGAGVSARRRSSRRKS